MFDFAAIRAKTTAARTPVVAEVELTKEQLIANHISTNFGCNQDAVLKLVTLMIGELPAPTEQPDTDKRPEIGTAARLDGETVIVYGKDGDGDRLFLTAKMKNQTEVGNSYIGSGEDWTYATPAQISTFERRVTA